MVRLYKCGKNSFPVHSKATDPIRKEKKTIFSSQGIALQNMKVATDDCGHVGFTILLEQKYENDGDEVKCEVKCLVVE